MRSIHASRLGVLIFHFLIFTASTSAVPPTNVHLQGTAALAGLESSRGRNCTTTQHNSVSIVHPHYSKENFKFLLGNLQYNTLIWCSSPYLSSTVIVICESRQARDQVLAWIQALNPYFPIYAQVVDITVGNTDLSESADNDQLLNNQNDDVEADAQASNSSMNLMDSEMTKTPSSGNDNQFGPMQWEVLLIFVALAGGVIARYFSVRYFSFKKMGAHVGANVTIYLAGIGLGLLGTIYTNVGALTLTLVNWEAQMVFCVFLPVLIFKSAFTIDIATLQPLFWKCTLLSFPGCVFSAVLHALVANACIYGLWPEAGWRERLYASALFGAINSCTDPFNIIARFRGMDCQPKRSLAVIEGESLMNTATAVIMYQCCHRLYLQPDGLLVFLVELLLSVLVAGPLFGWMLARCCSWLLKRMFNEPFGEVLLAITCALISSAAIVCALTLIQGQSEAVGGSGILAVLAYGVVLNYRRSSISPEVTQFMAHAMTSISFVINTVIFLLVGIQTVWMFRAAFTQASSPSSPVYIIICLVVFIASLIIRFITVCLFSRLPPFEPRITWEEALIISFGGMKGVVGLALALDLYQTHIMDYQDPDNVVYNGMAGLSAIIIVASMVTGGPAIPYLEEWLKLEAIEEHRKEALRQAFDGISREAQHVVGVLQMDSVLADAHWAMVEEQTIGTFCNPYESEKGLRLVDMSEKMHAQVIRAFKLAVWRRHAEGVAADTTVRRLQKMADMALERNQRIHTAAAELCDMHMDPNNPAPMQLLSRFLLKFECTRPKRFMKLVFQSHDLACNFIHCFSSVIENLPILCGDNSVVMNEVKESIMMGIRLMQGRLQNLSFYHPKVTIAVKTKTATRLVLNSCRKRISQILAQGLLEDDDAKLIIRQIESSMAKNETRHLLELTPPCPHALLMGLSWFRCESDGIKDALLACKIISCAEGTCLQVAGLPMDGIGLIVSGIARVENEMCQSDYLGPGQPFNVYSIVTGSQNLETVYAQTRLQYYWFPPNVIGPALQKSPGLGRSLMRSINIRLGTRILMKHIPHVLWGRAKIQEYFQKGWLLKLSQGDTNSKEHTPQSWPRSSPSHKGKRAHVVVNIASGGYLDVALLPQFEFLLLSGSATLEEGEQHAPCYLKINDVPLARSRRSRQSIETESVHHPSTDDIGTEIESTLIRIHVSTWIWAIPRVRDDDPDWDEPSVDLEFDTEGDEEPLRITPS